MRVREYGLVHPMWRAATFTSPSLFAGKCGHMKLWRKNSDTAAVLAKDGYLGQAKSVEVVGWLCSRHVVSLKEMIELCLNVNTIKFDFAHIAPARSPRNR